MNPSRRSHVQNVALQPQWGKSSASTVVNISNTDVATVAPLLKLYPGFAATAEESYTSKNSRYNLQLRKPEKYLKKKSQKGTGKYHSL